MSNSAPDSILDKMKEHFKDQRSELKKYHCKDLEMDIYFRPTANCAETDKYLPLLQAGQMEGYVQLVITRSLDETGRRKLFKPKDAEALRKDVDPDLVAEIGNAILGVDDDERREAIETEKKS